MIRWAAKYFNTTPQVITDGILYVLIALSGGIATTLNNDEAAKHVPERLLFWSREMNGWFGLSMLSIKLFRSTTFADYVAERKRTGQTEFLTKSSTITTPPKD